MGMPWLIVFKRTRASTGRSGKGSHRLKVATAGQPWSPRTTSLLQLLLLLLLLLLLVVMLVVMTMVMTIRSSA
jgi:hypothetical protein